MDAQAERGTLYEAGSWAEIEACLFGPRPEDGGETKVLALPTVLGPSSPEGTAHSAPSPACSWQVLGACPGVYIRSEAAARSRCCARRLLGSLSS